MTGLVSFSVVNPPTSLEVIEMIHDAVMTEEKERKTTIKMLGMYAVPKPEIIDCEFEIKRISYTDENTQLIIGRKSTGGLIHIRTADNPEEPAIATTVA